MSFVVESCLYGSIEVYNNDFCFRTISEYSHYELCYVRLLQDCMLDVKSFSLEINYDYLIYNTYTWTGDNGPADFMEVSSGNRFVFTSDSSVLYPGFDICCQFTPSPTVEEQEENYQLIGGDSTKGNVYLNGQPICHNGWDDADADVVCRKIGFDYGEATYSSLFGEVDESFILTEVGCDGGESTIWDCPSFTTAVWEEYEGAGVQCYYDDDGGLELGFIYLAAIIFVVCFVVFCCWRWCKNNKAQQRNAQGGIQITAPPGEPQEKRGRIHSSTGISNGVAIEREGVPTNTHGLIRSARESYQPTRTNTFQDYTRPKLDSSSDKQAEGVSSRGGTVTTYETRHGATDEANNLGPVAPNYGVSAPSDLPPPAWAPPPAYAAPAYEPPAY